MAVEPGLGNTEHKRLLKAAGEVLPPAIQDEEMDFQFVLPRPKAKAGALQDMPVDEPDPEDPRAELRIAAAAKAKAEQAGEWHDAENWQTQIIRLLKKN